MYTLEKRFSPMPSNIDYWWNFGSLLGMCLMIQIMSGVFLSFYYENNMETTFHSINQIERNINMGWMIRSIHANGASLFFIFIYMHIGRGIFFKSFTKTLVWYSGITLLLTLFMTAFIGYVLPWGQMSYWGATVITNLMSSIPYAGKHMTMWLWGNFTVSKSTLMRFFSLHFILPFTMLSITALHIMFLHKKSSSTPLSTNPLMDSAPFFPYFLWKDLTPMLISILILFSITTLTPYALMDPDNFISANPMVTPPHIQPEWYFLFAYAILRTIPNKLGGVLALLSAVSIIMALPSTHKTYTYEPFSNLENKMMKKIIFFFWANNLLFLSVMGAMPIESPFIMLAQMSSVLYFMGFSAFI